jgi:type I restriction enzyme M protein
MTQKDQLQLGNTLWGIANDLRGAMNADDFRDYMLSFLFLRYLSYNYEESAQKELGSDYPQLEENDGRTALGVWYAQNEIDIPEFEKQMRRKVHYVIKPDYLWSNIAEMARTQNGELLVTLEAGFRYIENESFESAFQGLFSEINLNSEKLGKTNTDRNKKLCTIIQKIAEGIADFSTDSDTLGDAYEYLIGQFAAGSGKKAGEFYTPQQISSILSEIVTLDSQDPTTGKKKKLDKVLDFACGSGSLLLNVRTRIKNTFWQLVKLGGEIRQIHLLESPKVEDYITTYPKDGDNTITTKVAKKDWELLDEENQLGRIWINEEQYFDNIPLVAWEFYIGGYQPAQKWLKDRKERTLEFDDILHYQKIIVALSETDRLMKEIDKIEIE